MKFKMKNHSGDFSSEWTKKKIVILIIQFREYHLFRNAVTLWL